MSLDRRDCLRMIGLALGPSMLGTATRARAATMAEQSRPSAHSFTFMRPDGGTLALADHAKGPILIVNTATACGFAPQFVGLQQLWLRFGERGLTVIAAPSNDFGRQEPLSGHEIAAAARERFGVTFPFTTILSVQGADAHPFYRWAAAERPGEAPQWNFHKYLIGRDGRLAASFSTAIEPTDPRIIRAIAQALDTPI